MMLVKIHAKSPMEVFHPSLLFLININREEHTWGGEGIYVLACVKKVDSILLELNMLK